LPQINVATSHFWSHAKYLCFVS